jgi:hypothetical protein
LACRTISFHFFLSPTLSIIVTSIQLFPFFDFRNNKLLLHGVVSPTPNPQPGRPGYPFLSGSSPLTRLEWEALPVAYPTASIALGIMWPHKPHHYVKLGIPSGGYLYLHVPNSGISQKFSWSVSVLLVWDRDRRKRLSCNEAIQIPNRSLVNFWLGYRIPSIE